jgi:uracil-DNA glycosylase family 4
VKYRESVEPRASFRNEIYWKRPVPGFGDTNAWLMIVGLAPAAHGGNRTGRVFTGDESGRFLIEGLYEVGLANKPTSISKDDGLILKGCYLTAAVKCVPPDNRPTSKEYTNCRRYLLSELKAIPSISAILALGREAFKQCVLLGESYGIKGDKTEFKHGARYTFDHFPALYASYHPSPHNTYTGRLTKPMFVDLLRAIVRQNSPIKY